MTNKERATSPRLNHDDDVQPALVERIDLGEAGPYAIAFAPNGDLWVTLVNTGELLRREPDGTEHRFAIGERPGLLSVTPEAAWCAVSGEDRLAKVTPDGALSFFDAPGGPYGVAATADAVWTTLMQANTIASFGADGRNADIPIPVDGAFPAMLAIDDEGSVWVSLNQGHALARSDPAGGFDLIELGEGAAPVGIAASGGYVWAADIARGRVIRVDANRQVEQFGLGAESRPHAIITDGDGCWFTEWGANRLGRIDAAGRLTEYDLSAVGVEPHGLALDRDGIVWVAFENGIVAGFSGGRAAGEQH